MKRWEMLKYTATVHDIKDLDDVTSFAYVHGDCELTDVFQSKEEALKYLFADGNPIMVKHDKDDGLFDVSAYCVQLVEYDDLGNCVDEGELIY